MSDLLGILYSIYIYNHQNVQIVAVNWTNVMYLQGNIWNYFFESLTDENLDECKTVKFQNESKRVEKMIGMSNVRKELHKIWSTFKIKNHLSFSQYANTTGFYIRTTDVTKNRLASLHDTELMIEYILSNNLKEIFIAGDSNSEIEKIKTKTNITIYCNDSYRSNGGLGSPGHREWIRQCSGEKLANDVMNDMFALSCCKNVIMIGGGNVTNMASILNPNLHFHNLILEEKLKYTKWK